MNPRDSKAKVVRGSKIEVPDTEIKHLSGNILKLKLGF